MNATLWRWLTAALLSVILAACGGGGSSDEAGQPPQNKQCETSDNEPDPNDPNCGQLMIGMTDADGDFLSYQVDVTALTLVRSDGVRVEVLPTRTRIDFAQYVELSELLTAATVPTGRYVSGEIRLDYSAADIQVEQNGGVVAALAVDSNGNALSTLTLAIQLDNGRPLRIAPGVPAMLQLDFNLAASHEVNLQSSPVTVQVEPVLLASVEPLDEREFRLRGALLGVNEADSYYRAALRPFWDRDSRRGGVRIYTDAQTAFLVNGDAYTGSAGLTAMAALPTASATLAHGTYLRAEKKFVAEEVWAGSSVPGGTLDAVEGVVLARDGNTLTVFGATLVRASGSVSFRETLTLTLTDDTRVNKPRSGETDLDLSVISVGQRITALGQLTRDDADNATVTADLVLLRLTSLGGSLLLQQPGQLTLDLQAIAGLSPARFDFTGTGVSAAFDADADAYEISTPNSFVTPYAVAAPIRALGYVSAFGTAPADFSAISVQDYSSARAQLVVGFGSEGSATPFSSATDAGLVIDLQDDALGNRHHLLRGGLVVDLQSLVASPLLVPAADGRDWYALRTGAGVFMYSDYATFLTELNARLSSGSEVFKLHAIGGYQADNNQFRIRALAVVLR